MNDFDFQLNEAQLEQLRDSFDQNNLTVVNLKNGPMFIEDFQTGAALEVFVSSVSGVRATLGTPDGYTDLPVDSFEHLISEISRIRSEVERDLV